MSSVTYSFIDGAAFDIALTDIGLIFGATYRDIDWQALTKSSQRTFYFDALPSKKDLESEMEFKIRLQEKQEKFSFLKRVPGLHIREGFTRLRENSRRPTLQQKGVDVALAVEVLRQTHHDNMAIARLFLNDLDFFPLLEALTDTKVVSELVYRPVKTAPELIEAADRSEPLDTLLIYNCLQYSKRDQFPLEGWPSEDFSSNRTVATGSNRLGQARIVRSADNKKYGIEGDQVGGRYQTTSNCLELLVSHYEACSQCTTTWSDGWEPSSERRK